MDVVGGSSSGAWNYVVTVAGLIGGVGGLVALASMVVTYYLYRDSRHWQRVDAFLRIVDRLETPDKRDLRKSVYNLDRLAFTQWTTDQQRNAEMWIAELDLIAILILNQHVHLRALCEMYGDVLVRSAYQLAPYIARAREDKGRQFALPFGRATFLLEATWRRGIGKRIFPEEIRLQQGARPICLTPDIMAADEHCKTLSASGFRLDGKRKHFWMKH